MVSGQWSMVHDEEARKNKQQVEQRPSRREMRYKVWPADNSNKE
jgi:hypothetical protein